MLYPDAATSRWTKQTRNLHWQGKEYHEGDCISLDGSTGNIYDGIIPTVPATIAGESGRIMGWADKFRTMKVRTNADTPADAKKHVSWVQKVSVFAVPEHMFFEGNRIDAFREMICSETRRKEKLHWLKILPEQQNNYRLVFGFCLNRFLFLVFLQLSFQLVIQIHRKYSACLRDQLTFT